MFRRFRKFRSPQVPVPHISEHPRKPADQNIAGSPFRSRNSTLETFDRDTIYLHLYLEQLDVYGKNARRMRVRYTYRDLHDILKALLSGRDEQFVGILVKGYHVTPQILVHLRSVHWYFKVVSDSKNFNNKCIGAAFSSLARGQSFSSFTVGTGTYAPVNSSCAHPPPGNCGAFARIVSPGGRALAYPRATPGLLTHVVSDSKSKRRRFYRKRPVVCLWLACLSRTGPNCGGF